MKALSLPSLLALTAAFIPAMGAEPAPRLVTLGGPVTEIVFALGAGESVVAVDQSSTFPPAVTELPQVGYVGALGAEGVLSVEPGHILATSRLGPPAVAEQLRESGVPLTLVDNPHDAESLREAVLTVGEALDRTEAAKALWEDIASDLAGARAVVPAEESPRVVFLLGSSGQAMAAGKGTQGAGIVALAGGTSVFTGHFGYKPVSEEALLGLDPDVLLVASHRPDSEASGAEILRRLGLDLLAKTHADRVHAVDLARTLSFGPRTGEAATELARLFAGKAAE